MSEPIQLDPTEIAKVTRARAAQTYADMLEEIAQLTVYVRMLEQRLATQQQPEPPAAPDAWGDTST